MENIEFKCHCDEDCQKSLIIRNYDKTGRIEFEIDGNAIVLTIKDQGKLLDNLTTLIREFYRGRK